MLSILKRSSDSRYPFQPWYVKAYRQIRYKPKWLILYVIFVVRYYLGLTEYEYPVDLADMWHFYRSHCAIDMQDYITSKEWIEQLRSQSNEIV